MAKAGDQPKEKEEEKQKKKKREEKDRKEKIVLKNCSRNNKKVFFVSCLCSKCVPNVFPGTKKQI